MSCVFLTFFFHYEIKAGHKFISLTMKADFEKNIKVWLENLVYISWRITFGCPGSLIYINKPKEMDKILSPVMVALWRGVPPENNM